MTITIPTEATPLTWPNGKPRTATRIASPFFRRKVNHGGWSERDKRTPLEGIQLIIAELGRIQDLEQLAIQVAKAKAGLAYARRPEAADVPRIQRREAEHAAIGELTMGLRFGFDICIRNGYPVPEPVEDDDVQPFAKLKALAGKAKTTMTTKTKGDEG